jgi:hypothetical protein
MLVPILKRWFYVGQGYFKMLLSLVEELLLLLHVRLLVSPVHDKMQSVWIEKFGFARATDQKVIILSFFLYFSFVFLLKNW